MAVLPEHGGLSRRDLGAGVFGFVTGAGVSRLAGPAPETRVERVIIETPEVRERREAYEHFLGIVTRFTNAVEMSPVPFPGPDAPLPSRQFVYMNPGQGSRSKELTRALYLPADGYPDPTQELPTVKVVQQYGESPNQPAWWIDINAFIDYDGRSLATIGIRNVNNDVENQGHPRYFPQDRDDMLRLVKPFMKVPGFDGPDGWADFPTPKEAALNDLIPRKPFGITKSVVDQGLQVSVLMLETCEVKVQVSPVSSHPRSDPHTPLRV